MRGKQGVVLTKPWHVPSLIPGGQYNIVGRAWTKARLRCVRPRVLAERVLGALQTSLCFRFLLCNMNY